MSANIAAETDPTMSAIRAILHETTPELDAPMPRQPVKTDEVQPIRASKAQERVRMDAEESLKGQSREKPSQKHFSSKALKIPFQLNRKLIGAVAFVALVVFRPHWVFLGVILTLFVVLGAFALCGADRVWGGVMRGFNRFTVRSPEKAQAFAKRMDRFAVRWDGFLDRFPDGMLDGLYLPDFQSIKEAEERHDAVVDARLSRLQAEG